MTLLAAVAVAALVAGAAATGVGAPVPSRAQLLRMLSPAGRVPQGVPADFECAWRALALDYAKQLQPTRPAAAFQDIFDGLELGSLCNQTFKAPVAQQLSSLSSSSSAAAAAATTVYVDAVGGSDSNAGTQAAPFATVAFAVTAVRSMPQPAAIVLRGTGVHRITSTIVLTAADSDLTIAAFPGEQPVLSSGAVLKTQWQPAADVTDALARRAAATAAGAAQQPAPAAVAAAVAGAAPNPCASPAKWVSFPGIDAMDGDWPDPNVHNVSTTPTQDACLAMCQAASNPPCNAWIWYSPAGQFGQQWDGQCFLRSDSTFIMVAQDNTFSGRCFVPPPPPPPPNVFVADLGAAGTPLPAGVTSSNDFTLTLFYSPDGGRSPQRAFRARYPNANLERDLFPVGWASGGTRIKVPCDPSTFNVTHVSLPQNYGPGMFADYYFGEGGTCSRFQDGEWIDGPTTISYWCQPNGRTASCTYLVASPVGIELTQDSLPNAPYASDVAANGAIVQYWREGHWFSMMVRVANATYGADNSTTLGWDYGAFQGAEGDASGEDWYIEHVKEELDSAREFYFEAATQRLWYFHNATQGTPPPAGWTFEAPMLATLFDVRGTQAAPVRNVTFDGLTITGAAASYMMAHGIPSGGDWGLARVGAIRIEGAEGTTVRNSLFTRCDGTGVSINGYARDTNIDQNEFVWMGEGGVASWGKTQGVDATAMQLPLGTRMTGNLCHEIGHYEKQVSCYFAAVSGEAYIADNIFYNMPRAAINFNDDAVGGSLMTRNLVWNTCRESQDHGPFNSWGRVPYLLPWLNGTAGVGIKRAVDEISLNFIVAGGGANGGALDHDDGSSFYDDHDNFFVYGGHKSDFDGHRKQSYGNLMAFANVYGSKCVGIGNAPHAAPNAFFAEGFFNNTCILSGAGDPYLDIGDCVADATLANRVVLGGNKIMSPGGTAASVSCGKTYTFPEWIALGLDVGTTLSDVPATADIISMARNLLSIA